MNALLATVRSRTSVEVAREYAIVVCFIALFVTLTGTANHFLTTENMLNTAESGAIYGVVACALTLLLIVGEFDLSVGAIYVVSGTFAAKLALSVGIWPALGIGVAFGLGVGLANGVAVTFLRVNSFVATLATSLMLVGLNTRITNGANIYIDQSLHPTFYELGNSKALGIDTFVWIFIAFAVVCAFVLARTKLGRWLYATGGNAEAARLSGINTVALRIGAFAFTGLAAGLAGVIEVSRAGSAVQGDGLADIVFPAIAAVVVGGTSILGGRGAIWRTVLGIFFLQFISNGFNLLEVDSNYQQIIRGAIILIAVAIDTLSRRTA